MRAATNGETSDTFVNDVNNVPPVHSNLFSLFSFSVADTLPFLAPEDCPFFPDVLFLLGILYIVICVMQQEQTEYIQYDIVWDLSVDNYLDTRV